MLDTFKKMLLINPNISNNTLPSSDKEVQGKRKEIFNVIQSNTNLQLEQEKQVKLANMSLLENSYIDSESYDIDKITKSFNKMQNAIDNKKEGWVYFYDTETLGLPKEMGGNTLENDAFLVTEASILKQKYVNGERVGKPVLVKNFTSGMDKNDLFTIVDRIKRQTNKATNSDEKMTQTLVSTLQRIAGYHLGFDDLGDVIEHDANVAINDPKIMNKAIMVLSGEDKGRYKLRQDPKQTALRQLYSPEELQRLQQMDVNGRPKYIKSTNLQGKLNKDYVEGVTDLYNTLLNASKEENSVLIAMNGEKFDNPILTSLFKSVGIDVDEKTLFKNFTDAQVLYKQLIEKEIYDDIDKINEKNPDKQISKSTKVKDVYEASKNRHKETIAQDYINTSDHVAATDNIKALIGNDAYYKEMKNKLQEIKKDTEKNSFDISNSFIHMDNAYVNKDNTLSFSVKNGKVNTYNPSLLEAGHTYTASVINPKDLDNADSLFDNIQELKDKTIVKFNDAYENYDRQAYLIVDDIKDIQKNIFDTGIAWGEKQSDNPIMLLKQQYQIAEATENAIADNTRRNVDNFTRINSNKGFKHFNMYVNQMDQLVKNKIEDGTGNGKERILELIEKSKTDKNADDELKKVLSVLTVSHDEEINIVPERLDMFMNRYEDFAKNHELYKSITSGVNASINSNAIETNVAEKGYIKNLKYDTKTETLARTINNIKDEALNLLTDDEVMESYIDSNKDLKAIYQNEILKHKEKELKEFVKYAPSSSSIPKKEVKRILKLGVNSPEFEPQDKATLRKIAFVKYYGKDKVENGVKNIEEVRKHIFGYTQVKEDLRKGMTIDILNKQAGQDATYTSLKIRNKVQFRQDLQKKIRISSVTANHKSEPARRAGMNYADNIAKDLAERGLVDKNIIEKIQKADTINSKSLLIADALFDTKDEIDDLIKKSDINRNINNAFTIEDINFKHLTKQEENTVKRFFENKNINKIYQPPKTFSVLGTDIIGFFKQHNKTPNNINEIINKSIEAPKLTALFYNNANKKQVIDENINAFTNILQNKLNWNEQNINTFMDKIIKGNKLNEITYNNGYKKGTKQFMSTAIITNNDDYYLSLIPQDKYKMFADKLSRGASVEELQKISVTTKLPKVEELLGSKYVSQTSTSKKNIYTTYDLVKNKNGIPVYAKKDNIDKFIEDYNMALTPIKQRIEDQNFESANARAKRAWKNINESKTLTGVTARSKFKGQGYYGETIDKQFSPNRMDIAKRDMKDISQLIYSIDEVVEKNPQLYESMIDTLGENNAKNLIDKVKAANNYMITSTKPYIKQAEKNLFNNLSINEKFWFEKSIGDIAGTILNTDNLNVKYKDIKDDLEIIKEKGSQIFFVKDSGDANKGYAILQTPFDYGAGTRNSNTARPLVEQTLGTQNISKEQIVERAKHILPHNNAFDLPNMTDEEILDNLNIKMGHSFVTQDTSTFVQKLSELPGEQNIGFSTPVAKMSSETYMTTLHNINNNRELLEDVKKAAYDKYGIAADNNEIYREAERMLSASNLYEDSGVVSPLLAMTMPPQTVSTVKIDENLTSKFESEIGSVIEPDTIIGIDKTGSPIRYSKEPTRIVGVEKGRIYIQSNPDYYTFKAGLGGGEKAELIVPHFEDSRQALIYDTLLKKMSGGANIILNPGMQGHEAFNSMFTSYTNAITNNIKTTQEAEMVNKMIKKYVPEKEMKVQYSSASKRYELVEGKTLNPNTNVYDSYINLIDELKNGKSDYSKRLKESISKIEVDTSKMNSVSTFWGDISKMQDNTIQHGQGGRNVNAGASLSYRAEEVLGAYVGEIGDDIELNEYLNYKNGKIANKLQPLIDETNNIILSDQKTKQALKEVSNIKIALRSTMGKETENAVVRDFNLLDAINGTSYIDAAMLPDIYSLNALDKNGNRVNAYRINLKDDNLLAKMEIKNPFYVPNGNQSEKITEMFVPVLNPNKVEGEYILTESQKKTADMLDIIYNIQKGTYNGNFNEANEKLNSAYKDMIEAELYDLEHKEGLYKSTLKAKMPFSTRAKSANIVAPILNENGRYLDERLAKISDIGEGKMIDIVELNPKEFTSKFNLQTQTIGKQLLYDNIDETGEGFKIIKNHLQQILQSNSIDNISTKEELIKTIEKQKIPNDKLTMAYREAGEDYLHNVGITGVMMRDPAMKDSSFQVVKYVANADVPYNTTSMGATVAKLINADSDGDETNTLLTWSLYNDKNGTVKVRNLDSETMKAMNDFKEAAGKSNYQKLQNLAEELKEKTIKEGKAQNIKDYSKVVTESFKKNIEKQSSITGEAIKNIATDYIANEGTMATGLIARLAKASIGIVSNANFYVKRAKKDYFAPRADDIQVGRKIRAVSAMTNLAEQKLIDAKSFAKAFDTPQEAAKAMMTLSNLYGKSIANLAQDNVVKQRSGIEGILRSVGMIIDDNALPEGITKEDLKSEENLQAITDKIEDFKDRIMSGEYNRSTSKDATISLEEMIGTTYDVLNSEEGKNAFWDKKTRLKREYEVAGEKQTLDKRINDVVNFTEGNEDDLLTRANGTGYIQDTPQLNEKALQPNTVINTTKYNKDLDEGVYKVLNSEVNNGNYILNLQDVSTHKTKQIISDKSFADLSNRMSDYAEIYKEIPGTNNVERKIVNREIERFSQEMLSNSEKFSELNNKANTTLQAVLQSSMLNDEYKDMSVKHVVNNQIFNNKTSTLSVQDRALVKASAQYNQKSAKEFVDLKDLLVENNYLTDKQATDLTRQMNEFLKDPDYQVYRRKQKELLLKQPSLATVTEGQFDNFISSLKHKNEKIDFTQIQEQLNNIKKYDLDSVLKQTTEEVDRIIKESPKTSQFTEQDLNTIYKMINDTIKQEYETRNQDAINEIAEIYAKNAENKDFQKNILNWQDLSQTRLTQNEKLETLNSSKIAFGSHIGESINTLDNKTLIDILSETDDRIADNVVNKNKEIIKQVMSLSNNNNRAVVDNDNVIKELSKDSLDNIKEKTDITIDDLNREIKEKGATRKTSKAIDEKLKSTTEKTAHNINIDDIGDELKNSLTKFAKEHKKGLKIAGIAAAVATAAYISGTGTVKASNGSAIEKASKNNEEDSKNQNSLIKSLSAPPTEKKVYLSNTGATDIKISGRAPINSMPFSRTGILAKLFNQETSQLKGSIRDDRKDLTDKDLDDVISQVNMNN